MSGAGRYRVVGVLPESALADVRPGTVFERMAFDLRARVLLEAVPGGFVVRHEGFKKIVLRRRGVGPCLPVLQLPPTFPRLSRDLPVRSHP